MRLSDLQEPERVSGREGEWGKSSAECEARIGMGLGEGERGGMGERAFSSSSLRVRRYLGIEVSK